MGDGPGVVPGTPLAVPDGAARMADFVRPCGRLAARTARNGPAGGSHWWDGVGRSGASRGPGTAVAGQADLTDADLSDPGKREPADKPGSVLGNHPSGARVAARLERPTRKLLRAAGTGREARVFPYLVLLQVGFAVPPNVATGAVRSYRTLSPLPALHRCSA